MTVRTFAFPEESLDYQKAEATIRTVMEVCEFAARRALDNGERVRYDQEGVVLQGYLRVPEPGGVEMVVNASDGTTTQKLIMHCSKGGEFFVNEQASGARWEVLRDSRSGLLFYTEELP